uniref:Putative secreted protein n=1 Tax=Anopheles marajoara TaxID=58244 RepID=A0A2M4CCE8_9DIPT
MIECFIFIIIVSLRTSLLKANVVSEQDIWNEISFYLKKKHIQRAQTTRSRDTTGGKPLQSKSRKIFHKKILVAVIKYMI